MEHDHNLLAGNSQPSFNVCCQALTASCLACKNGISEAEFCADPENSRIQGCENKPNHHEPTYFRNAPEHVTDEMGQEHDVLLEDSPQPSKTTRGYLSAVPD